MVIQTKALKATIRGNMAEKDGVGLSQGKFTEIVRGYEEAYGKVLERNFFFQLDVGEQKRVIAALEKFKAISTSKSLTPDQMREKDCDVRKNLSHETQFTLRQIRFELLTRHRLQI